MSRCQDVNVYVCVDLCAGVYVIVVVCSCCLGARCMLVFVCILMCVCACWYVCCVGVCKKVTSYSPIC